MSLQTKVMEALKEAMKAKDSFRIAKSHQIGYIVSQNRSRSL